MNVQFKDDLDDLDEEDFDEEDDEEVENEINNGPGLKYLQQDDLDVSANV